MQQPGLRFWEVTAKEKKEVLFGSGELLWKAANEYFNYCADNPIEPAVGQQVKTRVSPFSLQGFCLYMGCTTKYFKDIKIDLDLREEKLSEAEEELLSTMDRIEDVISTFKYSYAVTGLLNVRMIMHDLEINGGKTVVKRIIRVREG